MTLQGLFLRDLKIYILKLRAKFYIRQALIFKTVENSEPFLARQDPAEMGINPLFHNP